MLVLVPDDKVLFVVGDVGTRDPFWRVGEDRNVGIRIRPPDHERSGLLLISAQEVLGLLIEQNLS